MTPLTFKRAGTIFAKDLRDSSAQPSAGRGRYSAVCASLSLPIDQFAVDATEMKLSLVGAVPEHRRLRSRLKSLALQSFGTKDGLGVIKMLNFLVFGVSGELEDDMTTADDC